MAEQEIIYQVTEEEPKKKELKVPEPIKKFGGFLKKNATKIILGAGVGALAIAYGFKKGKDAVYAELENYRDDEDPDDEDIIDGEEEEIEDDSTEETEVETDKTDN